MAVLAHGSARGHRRWPRSGSREVQAAGGYGRRDDARNGIYGGLGCVYPMSMVYVAWYVARAGGLSARHSTTAAGSAVMGDD